MSHKPSPYLSELKRVRGLGAAHEGTGHFWLQRTTALAMIPLSVWFLYALFSHLLSADRLQVAAWFKDPVTAVLMAIFVSAMFLHARLGVQTIIEDYVHCECAKITLLVINSGLQLLLCLASLIAIAHLHFNGI